MALLEVKNLVKRWPNGRLALDNVSFEMRQGEILGLLGHNGAGKSTILGITLGMVQPDEGEVRIAGHSVQEHRSHALAHVGAIYEAAHFYDYLTGWQNLRVLCSLSGWWDEEEVKRVLKLVNLGERAHHKTRTYSHGMRQRLALAQALLPMPKCLLLDEPTDGLDPEGIREFREFVMKLRSDFGMTILLNSHLLAEVEQMCDRCVILKQGKKMYEGPVPSQDRQQSVYLLQTRDLAKAREVFSRSGVTFDAATRQITLPPHLAGHEVLKQLVEAEVRVESWQPHKATLEEFYLGLTGA
ncbi:ABC-2 type transport system ATP-binding protein [Prosthecobacter debontii]|uniref:ABC-2 type transport system ATP-binding protein n=1 Tax=Prosthecobacter debontii TaxID=48467 RepID=A0A1T4Y5E0_9BACT|nr:ABC transporter ATP-binding protein [Prosthecobacter debontii]SKA96956.1 ABC-2 type transport system ATP-binding protein [Prosthecobacter debontii]